MKYMLLIYQNPAAWENLSEEERNRVFGDVDALVGELNRSGEFVGGEGLAHPSNTKTVRVRDGVPAVTDGPFVESKEQLVGYTIVQCETPERAIEIAARWPDARYWALEVRPIMEPGGEEM
ncbi:MAG TPA: YciI family protein [Acidimicrobiia bacterium]